jgi:hypothetical protein
MVISQKRGHVGVLPAAAVELVVTVGLSVEKNAWASALRTVAVDDDLYNSRTIPCPLQS